MSSSEQDFESSCAAQLPLPVAILDDAAAPQEA